MVVKNRNELPASVGCPAVLILLAICGYLIWSLISSIRADWRSPPASPSAPAELTSKEEKLATLINLNGMLCAKVILVSPEIGPSEYQVNCKEYRDPKKAGTKNNIVAYIVNLERGSVRLAGRG